MARHRHDKEQVQGASDSPQLMAGHFQPLSAHPESAYNQSWLITKLKYQGKQPQVLGKLVDGQSTYNAINYFQENDITFIIKNKLINDLINSK